MSPVYFRGQSAVCEAPPDHDPRTCPLGEIVGLPVLFLTDAHGRHLGFRSVWRPSPEEIAGIVAGGGIMVDVMAPRQPPVSLGVCHPADVLVEA